MRLTQIVMAMGFAAATMLPSGAEAQPAATSAARTGGSSPSAAAPPPAAASGSARETPGPVASGAPLPAGHPSVAAGGDTDGETDPHAGAHPGGDPHAGGGVPGMFEPPEDGSLEDPTIPPGTIEVHIADPEGRPKARTEVTLGIVYNSVAKGESRKRLSATTNDVGAVRFDKLDQGAGIAYRAMVMSEGATFSAPPFQLPAKSGMRVILHVYPVVHEVQDTLIVTQSMIYTEVKDDRVQIQQAFKIYNFGKSAWVPHDLVVDLPPDYTAFTAQQGMTDVGVDAIPKKGVKLRGTFAPGQHVVEFRWQLPYSGEADVHFDVGMTPHMAASRVIAPAAKAMTLEVEGFPPPQPTTDGQGQRALFTEKQIRRDEAPLKSVRVVVKGLPTEGPGKLVATLLAAGGIGIGLVFGVRKPQSQNRKKERARVLAELANLERAFSAKEVGPKTYERARRELVDEIARTFVTEGPPRRPKK